MPDWVVEEVVVEVEDILHNMVAGGIHQVAVEVADNQQLLDLLQYHRYQDRRLHQIPDIHNTAWKGTFFYSTLKIKIEYNHNFAKVTKNNTVSIFYLL